MDGELGLVRIVERLLFPPAGPLLIALAGLLLRSRLRRIGAALALFGIALLIASSLPVTARALMGPLERQASLDPAEVSAQQARAIVVLAGGSRTRAPEYGGATVSPSTLERLRYGARLHHLTGLPVVVSGGLGEGERRSEGFYMRRALRELGVGEVQVEGHSTNTAENARFTARLLGPGHPVILVTHAAHMPRAVRQFEAAGLEVIPAPTGFTGRNAGPFILDWLPSAGAMELTATALHEWVGRFWYALRY